MLFEDFKRNGRNGYALGASGCQELIADVGRELSAARKEGYAKGLVDASNDLALQQAYNNGRKDAKMGRSVRESEFLSDRHPDQFRVRPEEQEETGKDAAYEPYKDPWNHIASLRSAMQILANRLDGTQAKQGEQVRRVVDLEVSLRENRQLTNATLDTHLRRIVELETNVGRHRG